MAERANILEFPEPRHSARHSASGLGSFGDTQESVPARLLPGSHAGRQAQKNLSPLVRARAGITHVLSGFRNISWGS